MRVLFLASDAYGGHGGIAQSNRDFIEALSKYPGCAEIVVLPRIVSGPLEPVPNNVQNDQSGLGGKVNYIRAVLKRIMENFDLVICAHINLLSLGLLVAKWHRVPMLLFIYGIDVWNPSAFARRFAKCSAAVVSVSRISMDRFQSWAGVEENRCAVLPNCGHLEKFTPGPKNEELLKRYGLAERKVLMTLGRISADERYKGIDEVLQLMPELLIMEPALTYFVVGDGTDRPRLEKKARELGLSNSVIFTGRIKEEEKVAHYRLADAFVLAGFAEGFGIVCLEALACGIPVVGSKLDGTREALRDGELGLLADPADPKDLKAKLLAALAEKDRIPPAGLAFFSDRSYTERCHVFLGDFFGRSITKHR